MMDHLPHLGQDAARCCLPLLPATAQRIAAALVEPAADARRQLWHEALRADPCCALWAVLAAAAQGASDLRTADQLADWVDAQRLEPWTFELNSTSGQSHRLESDGLATIVGQSVQLAGVASCLASESIAAEAYLAGLLADARHVLQRCRPRISMRKAGMPNWLVALLRRAAALDPQAAQHRAGRKSRRQSAAANLVEPAAALATARAVCAGDLLPPRGKKQALAAAGRLGELAASAAGDAKPALARMLENLVGQLRHLERLETRFDSTLEQAKLEAMAEFAAGAGHEINNPLMVISGRVQLFLRSEDDPQRRRMLATLNRQTLRVSEMISDMMLFARPPEPRTETVDVAKIVDDVRTSLGELLAEREIRLIARGDQEPLWIQADGAQIAVVLRALCDNACEAIGRAGTIEIDLVRPAGVGDATDMIEIVVRDDGCGIDDAVRQHLFDPYYSGRQAGRGLGLGLAKCWRIVTMHGGTIDAQSHPGQGATLTVRLPVARSTSPEETATA